MEFRGKKVLVSGFGISGISAAKLLKKEGALVTLQDKKTEKELSEAESYEANKKELLSEGIELYIGSNPDDIIKDFDILVLSPGVPTDLDFVRKAEEYKIPVLGEIELAYCFCRSPIVAITGTNGKTTTTTLTGEILKAYYNNTFTVGNIGSPFADIALSTSEDGVVAAELSSFQLETITDFRPKVSAVLNITPDHLNRHHTLENYIAAKERIFENQTEEDYCVLNYNDEVTRKMAEKTKAEVIFFSVDRKLDKGIYADDGHIYIKTLGYDEILLDLSDIFIPGAHNVENIMAAAACCAAMKVPLDIIRKVIKDFRGVEHRIEYVATINDIEFYNDSKGTNPDASIKAVEAMKRPICLIAGGYDKQVSYAGWVDTFKGRVKFVAVIGQVRKLIAEELDRIGFTNYCIAESFEEAIDKCYENAGPGDCVLLSPASASWDMFRSYEQRGEIFKDHVRKLAEEAGK